MTINQVYIKRKFADAVPYLKRIKELTLLDVEKIVSDFDLKHSVERYIEILAQIIIDICFHITSRSQIKTPENYGECIQALISLNIIDKQVGIDIRNFIQLRNLIVHQYAVIKHDRIVDYLGKILNDFQLYKTSILEFINLD